MNSDKNIGNNIYLQVRIIQGVELDKQSKINEHTSSYVVVQYGDLTKQTTKIFGTANPTWLQTLSFDLTPIRKLKINVFYQGSGKEKRIGKVKQEFDPKKQEETTYTQKLTRGKLIYSIKVSRESLQSTSQPVIPPNPNNYTDLESSDSEEMDPLPAEADPAPSDPATQRVFQALGPATPSGILESIIKAIAPKPVVSAPRGSGARGAIGAAIGTAIGQACIYMFCYAIVIVCIIFAVIFVIVTRFL